MKSFQWILEHANAHKGAEFVAASMPANKDAAQLRAVSDDRYLSAICQRVFRAGLKHALVDSKWPAFELAFYGFDPEKVSLMSDEQLEMQMQNEALIRHWGKLKSVRTNALMVAELSRQHGGFGQLIADWPGSEIIELWALLKKRGAHLGGQSAASFLRMVGKDTFRLTPDVVAALQAQGVVDKLPTSKGDLQKTQDAFNHWQAESGRPLSHISSLLAFTVGW